jgi:hypothetical protein
MALQNFVDGVGPVLSAAWLNNLDQAINGTPSLGQGANLIPVAPTTLLPGTTVGAQLAEISAALNLSTITINQTPTGQFWAGLGAKIQRFNDRSFFGGFTVADGNYPPVTNDWFSSYLDSEGYTLAAPLGTVNISTLVGSTAENTEALIVAAQALYGGSAGGSVIATSSFSINNHPTLFTEAWAYYGECHRVTAASGPITGMELDVRNVASAGTNPTPYPYLAGYPTTVAAGLNCGAGIGSMQCWGSITSNVLTTSAGTTGYAIQLAGGIVPGMFLYGVGISAGVTISSYGTAVATFTGTISGTTLTVSGVTGTIAVGQSVIGAGAGTMIMSGSGLSWQVNVSQTIGPVAMSSTNAYNVTATPNLASAPIIISNQYPGSAALVIANNVLPTYKGIVFFNESIYGCDGYNGSGTAIAFAKGHAMNWFNAAGNIIGTITSTVNTASNATSLAFTDLGVTVSSIAGNALMCIFGNSAAANYVATYAQPTGNGPVVGVGGTDAQIDLVLASGGTVGTTSSVKFSSTGMFSANGSVATALTSVGPTGSHATVQTWLTIRDNTGTTRYIPCF